MAGFYGEYRNSLDPKGRLAIPAKLRNGLPEGQRSQIYLTRGIGNYIVGRSKEDHDKFKIKLEMLDTNEAEKTKLKREFGSSSFEATFDKQGRVTIPEKLLKFANLAGETEAVILGTGDTIEIWNSVLYEKETEAGDITFREVMAQRNLDKSKTAADQTIIKENI